MTGLTRRNLLRVGLAGSPTLAGASKGGVASVQADALQAAKTTAEEAMPHAAAVAIGDLLDHGLYVRAGHKVLVLAHEDGLYGGDNLVDRDAIHWIRQALEERGAVPEVLWVDAQSQIHAWRFPEIIREALDRNERVIYHSFDLTPEEILAFRNYLSSYRKKPTSPEINITAVRNLASTAPLLCSTWAQTPQELVSQIRHQAGLRIQAGIGAKWELTDPLGTRLKGAILPAVGFSSYSAWREQGTGTQWPEWVIPPISLAETSGTFVFDRMLSWWSRYIGVPPFFESPIRLEIRNGKIVSIEGKSEADALRDFLKDLEGRTGEGVYDLNQMHFGVHPQARVAPQQCPNVLYRRLVEHCHTSNLHVHIGTPKPTPSYPYMVHITGDIRQPTFRIGDTLMHDAGHLTVLEDPKVCEVAERYPGRPGLGKEPFQG